MEGTVIREGEIRGRGRDLGCEELRDGLLDAEGGGAQWSASACICSFAQSWVRAPTRTATSATLRPKGDHSFRMRANLRFVLRVSPVSCSHSFSRAQMSLRLAGAWEATKNPESVTLTLPSTKPKNADVQGCFSRTLSAFLTSFRQTALAIVPKMVALA